MDNPNQLTPEMLLAIANRRAQAERDIGVAPSLDTTPYPPADLSAIGHPGTPSGPQPAAEPQMTSSANALPLPNPMLQAKQEAEEAERSGNNWGYFGLGGMLGLAATLPATWPALAAIGGMGGIGLGNLFSASRSGQQATQLRHQGN